MLQRMILGIISAIKTFMGDYLEQFNSNITNQLKTGFLICFLEEIKWIFCVPFWKEVSFDLMHNRASATGTCH